MARSVSAAKRKNIKRPKAAPARKKTAKRAVESESIKHRQGSFDSGLALVIVILVVFGLIMVYSASAPAASAYQGSPYYFIIRQAAYAIVGFAAMYILSKVDYHEYKRFMVMIFWANFLVLFMVYIPGLGRVINNARRWVYLGFISLQPSELVKAGVILYFSYSLSISKEKITDFWHGFMRYIIILGAIAVILYKEPHLSAMLVICAIGCILMLLAGAKVRHFMYIGSLALPLLAYKIYTSGYQLERITTFLDPFADKSGSGFQVVNSLYAIGSGGIFGLGLGMSRQKYLYLPEPQNDFIFAIVCEELGFLGAAIVIVLFGIFIWKGYKIAQKAPDMFGTLLAAGITSLVGIQAVVNIGVVTGWLPATGMALPFFSYGGTSLFILLCCMGILLNVSRQGFGEVHQINTNLK